MVEKAEMLGFSRVLRCWCGGKMIFKFYVRHYLENSLIIKILLSCLIEYIILFGVKSNVTLIDK